MKALDALERWFLAPRPLHALVAARIVFGSVLFVAYALRAPAALDLFGPDGIGGPGLEARVPGLPPFHPGAAPFLDLVRQIPSEPAVAIVYATLLASAAAFTLGAFTRIAGALAWTLHLLFWARNPIAYVGWASFLIGPLLYVVLAPVGRHLSIDAWWRRRRGLPPASWLASGWRLRLLQIHVCTLYADAGWSRLDKPAWLGGDMVQVALTSANFSRLAGDWSAWAPVLAAATWGSIVLEGLAPFLLWWPRVRRPWAWALVALHASLGVLMHHEIWAWSAVMIAGLGAFLFSDETPEARSAPPPRASEGAGRSGAVERAS
jgi:hypothetical protein